MTNILFHSKHRSEYVLYGIIAGLVHGLFVWLYIATTIFATGTAIYISSACFTIVIELYAIKLANRIAADTNLWSILGVAQLVILTGILVSVICSLLLCIIYVPGFMGKTGTGEPYPASESNLVYLIFSTATFWNYVAGTFISVSMAYVFGPAQLKKKI